MKGKRPDYIVNSVVDTDGEKARWREIGAAFTSGKHGMITVLLDALPVSGKLVLTPPKERQKESRATK